MSTGVFNFNVLALLLSEILGGSQIYTRGPYAPWTPPSRYCHGDITRREQQQYQHNKARTNPGRFNNFNISC